MSLKSAGLVGIAVEQQVIVQQQRLEVGPILQGGRQGDGGLDAEGSAIGIDRPVQGSFGTKEGEDRLAVQRGDDKNEGERRAKAESDFGVVLAAGVSPQDPFLLAINVAGKEIDDRDQSRLGQDGGVDQSGIGPGNTLPTGGNALSETDAERAGSGRLAQLLRVDLGGGQQPAVGYVKLRAA